MTRLNADLVKDFEFLEECRAGLEAIPEQLGRDTYLELHDHLVKTGVESAKFRSLMEREEPNGFEPEDFAIPLYLDKVYVTGWDRLNASDDDGTQPWNQHWTDALERGRDDAADFARLTDLAKERGISPTATFTNSYQLAGQRLKEMMHDRAHEVLNNIDAQQVNYIMRDHSDDPIKVRSEVESVLAGSGASEADQAYLLSVVNEYDAPGSALTREQANAEYPAPAWPQAQTPHLDASHQAPSMSM